MIASVSKAAAVRLRRKPWPPNDVGGLSLKGTRKSWMETLIAEGIGKSYKGRQVVRGVNLRISRGEVVGLLGPNGAGKTTSFYMTVGLVAPETGRVLIDS